MNHGSWHIHEGHALAVLPTLAEASVQCCVTSPPYWGLRDYGLPPIAWEAVEYAPMPGLAPVSVPAVEACWGLERTPEEFIAHCVAVFRAVRRVLREDGVVFLNIGDSYCAPNGRSGGGTYGRGPNSQLAHMHEAQERGIVRTWNALKPKDLIGIPWRLAFALQADGWYLRSDIIWAKPNPMPESVRDRPTKAHEYLFLLAKNERYFWDQEAVKERSDTEPHSRGGVHEPLGGPMDRNGHSQYDAAQQDRVWGSTTRNIRSVWKIATQPCPDAHFATFPEALPEKCILAGCPVGGTVLDICAGSGTTLLVAARHGRNAIGIEPNPEYIKIAKRRIAKGLRPGTFRDESKAEAGGLFVTGGAA